jgi:hypothetical protein
MDDGLDRENNEENLVIANVANSEMTTDWKYTNFGLLLKY